MKFIIKINFLLFMLCIFFSGCKKNTKEEESIDQPPNPLKAIDAAEFIKKVKTPLSNHLIFSKGIYLIRNTIIQSFDIDSKGSIFYNQLGGGLTHAIFVARGFPNRNHEDSMQLKYSGHGTNIAIEEDGEDRYLWTPTNGSKDSNGEYGSSKTFSRIKYIPNSVIESYGGDTYYLLGKANVHPAIDMKNDLLAITTSGGGDPLRYFYIYRLSKVKNIPLSTVTLPPLKFGGEEPGVPEQTVSRKIEVRDLSNLKPIASFGVSTGSRDGLLGFYSFQGFDIDGDKIYFYEGENNGNAVANGPSNAYVTVLNRRGQIVGESTKVEAISDVAKLNYFGLTATGFMEAEGIKMKDGVLYLGFASRSTDDRRLANIFWYR